MEKFLETELFQVFAYSFRPIKSIRCFDSSSEEEEEEETEDDFEQANPLLEQIRGSVSGALSATRIAVP